MSSKCLTKQCSGLATLAVNWGVRAIIMNTEIITGIQDGILLASASNGSDDYIIWQRPENELGEVHFEWDDQLNSGYNIVSECTIDEDGCHLALNTGVLVHFYWNPPRHKKLEEFISKLMKIYFKNESVISDLR